MTESGGCVSSLHGASMRLRCMRLAYSAALSLLIAAPLVGQASPEVTVRPCGDSATQPKRIALAVDLIYSGENRGDLWQAITAAGVGAPRQRCRNARAAVVTAGMPVLWGSFWGRSFQPLPSVFVRCVHRCSPTQR